MHFSHVNSSDSFCSLKTSLQTIELSIELVLSFSYPILHSVLRFYKFFFIKILVKPVRGGGQ